MRNVECCGFQKHCLRRVQVDVVVDVWTSATLATPAPIFVVTQLSSSKTSMPGHTPSIDDDHPVGHTIHLPRAGAGHEEYPIIMVDR